ncbi:MAG: tetratricopeptide repeat protein [Acidobacteriota bacterium]|jgi:predicted negative regulator of RcsB-dependent stress response
MSHDRLTKQKIRHDPVREFLNMSYTAIEEHVEDYWRAYLLMVIAILAVIVGGIFLWNHIQEKRAHASLLLSQAMDAYNAPVLPENTKLRQQLSARGQLYFTSSKEWAAEVNKRLKAVENASGSSATENTARLYLALTQARTGKLDEALKTSAPLINDDTFKPLALMLQGRIYESKGDLKKAEKSWSDLAKIHTDNFPQGQGLAFLAEFYTRTHQTAKAQKTYKELQSELTGKVDPKDPLLTRAKDQLKQLQGSA